MVSKVNTPLSVGERSIVMSVSVCVSLCVFSELHVRTFSKFSMHITYGRGSVLLWRRTCYVLPVFY